MPLTAFLIRRLPTKRLYLGGIFTFIAGLIISLLSNSFPVMMTGRVFQACGNGILIAIAQVVILSIYPEEKKGTIMGWYGLASGAAPVIAPTLAGVLVDLINWRAIFGLALAVMLISFLIACLVFEDVLETENKKFDFISFLLSVFAFGGVTLGVGNITTYGIASPGTLLPLCLGLITSVIFSWRQFSIQEPFLDLAILKNPSYRLSVIGSMLLYFIMMGSSVIMPLYVQSVMPLITWGTFHVDISLVADASALLVSLRTIAGAIGSAVFVGIMTLVAQRSSETYGDKALLHGLNIAFLCMTAGAVILFGIAVFFVKGKKKDATWKR